MTGLIVVGVDGSTASRDAVRWAAGQALLTGASLRAVSSWRWPNYITRIPPGVDPAAGAQGRAAFPGMLLGSVAEYCVRHGDCPVVVVRA